MSIIAHLPSCPYPNIRSAEGMKITVNKPDSEPVVIEFNKDWLQSQPANLRFDFCPFCGGLLERTEK